jgi:hypothetical protein
MCGESNQERNQECCSPHGESWRGSGRAQSRQRHALEDRASMTVVEKGVSEDNSVGVGRKWVLLLMNSRRSEGQCRRKPEIAGRVPGPRLTLFGDPCQVAKPPVKDTSFHPDAHVDSSARLRHWALLSKINGLPSPTPRQH